MAETKKNTEVVSDEENAKKALEIHKQQQLNLNSAEDSEIESIMGKTTTVTIAEDSEHPYTLTLRFPGTARASQIEDDASNQYGNINFTALMEQAIQYVIVSPKIKSLDFWDTHEGYSEVSAQVLNFLNAGLNGEI